MPRLLDPKELPDRSLLFEDLKDDVRVLVQVASKTELQFTMWRVLKDAEGNPEPTVPLAAETGPPNKDWFRRRLVEAARNGFGADNVPNIADEIESICVTLNSPAAGHGGKTVHGVMKEQAGGNVAQRLIDCASKGAELFHTPDQEAWASVPANSTGAGRRHYRVESEDFRLWLLNEFRRRERERNRATAEAMLAEMGPMVPEGGIPVPRPEIVRAQAMADAISDIKATAVLESPEHKVHIRVAEADGKIYLDLCNDKGEAVEMSVEGARIVEDPPVKFRRAEHMEAHPYPVIGAGAEGVEKLRKLLHLGNDKAGKVSWILLKAWLIQGLRPNGGGYPVLAIRGGHGTAKSDTTRFIRNTIDPSRTPHSRPTKDEHALYLEACANWVIAMDNVSWLPSWLSDSLCNIATEGALKLRKYYTDDEQRVLEAFRPIIMNGISNLVERNDLVDRALFVDLPVLTKEVRRTRRDVLAEFEEIRPYVLGGLIDATVEGLKKLPEVNLAELPRLADFFEWAVATEVALGGKPGCFLKAYEESREEGTRVTLEAEPVVHALIQVAKTYRDPAAPWRGSHKELLDRINDKETDDALKRAKEWPKTPRKLAELLKRLAPALVEVGVHIRKAGGSRRDGRLIEVFYQEPANPPGGDGRGDDYGDDVLDTVTKENPINKPSSANGDDGDGGDATETSRKEGPWGGDDEWGTL